MFIVNFADGTTAKERLDDNDTEGVYWDDLPDKPITALHLTLPVQAKRALNKYKLEGEKPELDYIELPPPTISISKYTKYYFANQAVNRIFSLNDGNGTVGGGVGTVTHQIIAGVDERNDFVLYIEVNKKTA